MSHPANTVSLFSAKEFLVTITISVSYLLVSAILIGFRADQLFLVACFNLLYYASSASRKLITGFSIFIVYWILFDYMKAFPNHRFNAVHIESLYNSEKYLFPIHVNGKTITANEFLAQHATTFLDVLSGIFYLCWIPVPLLFAGYLFYKDRAQFLQFAFTFFLVNMLGFVIYYVYPAAPPWYVAQHGFRFNPYTPGNMAGLQRFDDLIQVKLFESLYAKSSNVFAAMPSLHASYPIIVLYYGIKNKLGMVNVLFAIIMLGIWFAAVYTNHHYVLDVLAGILCAVIGILLYQKMLFSSRKVAVLYSGMLARII
jgi:hypothetical protein